MDCGTVDKGVVGRIFGRPRGARRDDIGETRGGGVERQRMEFAVNANPVIFLEVLREITTLSIAERELHGVLESTVVFLDLVLFGPVELGENFDVLMGENGTRGGLLELAAHLEESGGILIGILKA